MSDIHVLSVRHIGVEQAERLASELTTAHEQGVDLGSRMPHILAANASIIESRLNLQAALQDLSRMSEHLQGPALDAIQAIQALVKGIIENSDLTTKLLTTHLAVEQP